MPYEIRLDAPTGLAYVRYDGDLDLNKPVHDHLPRRLHDARSIESAFSTDEVRQLAAFAGAAFDKLSSTLFAERRTAIVASADLYFGFARMLTALSQQATRPLEDRFQVFRTFDEASAWLGLPPGTPDPGR